MSNFIIKFYFFTLCCCFTFVSGATECEWADPKTGVISNEYIWANKQIFNLKPRVIESCGKKFCTGLVVCRGTPSFPLIPYTKVIKCKANNDGNCDLATWCNLDGDIDKNEFKTVQFYPKVNAASTKPSVGMPVPKNKVE
ncbi:MAG: hypothetical protein H6625_03555 [Bdellovibrionaceae bacterium]|nr:hypothetical protein [Pseudobdellovibrionaceae bacterium]